MKAERFSSLTLTAIQAALKAGDILRKGFGTLYEIGIKPGKQNYVTEYDRASEIDIISMIEQTFPTHNILAEESGFLHQTEGEVLWIIDPLDGTNNFAHRIPIFAVSIAAYLKDQPLCGVIFQPLTHELFVAEKNHGAYLNGTRLAVSQTRNLENALMIGNLPYDAHSKPDLNIEHLMQLNQAGAVLRNFGSAALGLAYLAAGKVDAFWMYNLHPWDWAAGQLLIEEAGGVITHNQGCLPNFHGIAHVLATNPVLDQPLKNTLFSSYSTH